MKKYASVDEYINDAPDKTRSILKDLRKLIKSTAPDADEGVSYGMPGYKLNKKVLIYFAGWEDHISIYPTSSKVENSIPELAKYRTGKGTLQFSLDKPLPRSIIQDLIKLRVEEVK
jgi:uncharacterized protein YdhG (YjbR/CyaY superfamily)